MAELFDKISRIVASQVPRRQALKMLVGAIAGGAVTLALPGRAKAQTCPNQFVANGVACSSTPAAACTQARINAMTIAQNRCAPNCSPTCDAGVCNTSVNGGQTCGFATFRCTCTPGNPSMTAPR